MINRGYSEVRRLETFEERFAFLKQNLNGHVGEDTFGYDRYLNQMIYHSPEWRKVRNEVIVRDNACDLGCLDFEILGRIYIHHIVPITKDDILNRDPKVLDPNNLICCSKRTHDLLHYGAEPTISVGFTERRPNDTCPWRS